MNAELEDKALETTRVLVKTIYETEGETDSDPTGIVQEIYVECLELMKAPEKSQAVPATKVASAMIGTTCKIVSSS